MNNINNNINKVISLIFIIFPFLLVTGPAIPDIFVTLSAFYSLILCIFFSKSKQIKSIFFLLILLFYISMIISSILSEYKIFSLKSSVPYVRFIFFIFLIFILTNENNFFYKKYLFLFIFLAVLFVSIDTYLQFFFRNEIFGHKIGFDQNRLTGPFRDDERIVGSYLSKFIFISFGFLLHYFRATKFIILPFIFLLFVYVCIFLTGERMAFILTTFGFLLLLLFNLKYLNFFLYTLLVFLFFSFIILSSNDLVKNRMINTTLQVLGLNYLDGKITKYNDNFLDSHYGAHYLTAFEIFKDNMVKGSGPKTFRLVCSDEKYSKLNSKNIDIRCSTHPHNYYLQILSETGLIGTFFFISSMLSFIIFFFNKINFKNPLHNCTLISFLLFLWPIQSTGNIFNNWYGIYPYYYICLLIILINEKKSVSRPSA